VKYFIERLKNEAWAWRVRGRQNKRRVGMEGEEEGCKIFILSLLES